MPLYSSILFWCTKIFTFLSEKKYNKNGINKYSIDKNIIFKSELLFLNLTTNKYALIAFKIF